jgi:hypothetical protein
MEEERRASREVISWEVMLVEVVRRRKSVAHWGEVWREMLGERSGLGFAGGVEP